MLPAVDLYTVMIFDDLKFAIVIQLNPVQMEYKKNTNKCVSRK